MLPLHKNLMESLLTVPFRKNPMEILLVLLLQRHPMDQEQKHSSGVDFAHECSESTDADGCAVPQLKSDAVIAQLAARRSHNPKVVSSILTHRIDGASRRGRPHRWPSPAPGAAETPPLLVSLFSHLQHCSARRIPQAQPLLAPRPVATTLFLVSREPATILKTLFPSSGNTHKSKAKA